MLKKDRPSVSHAQSHNLTLFNAIIEKYLSLNLIFLYSFERSLSIQSYYKILATFSVLNNIDLSFRSRGRQEGRKEGEKDGGREGRKGKKAGRLSFKGKEGRVSRMRVRRENRRVLGTPGSQRTSSSGAAESVCCGDGTGVTCPGAGRRLGAGCKLGLTAPSSV